MDGGTIIMDVEAWRMLCGIIMDRLLEMDCPLFREGVSCSACSFGQRVARRPGKRAEPGSAPLETGAEPRDAQSSHDFLEKSLGYIFPFVENF